MQEELYSRSPMARAMDRIISEKGLGKPYVVLENAQGIEFAKITRELVDKTITFLETGDVNFLNEVEKKIVRRFAGEPINLRPLENKAYAELDRIMSEILGLPEYEREKVIQDETVNYYYNKGGGYGK